MNIRTTTPTALEAVHGGPFTTMVVMKDETQQCIAFCRISDSDDFHAAAIGSPVWSVAAARKIRIVDEPEVPAGRYAIENGGTLKFYEVDRPTKGRWRGRVFVSVQASDDLHPIRNRDARREILSIIAVDPGEAMRAYGRELGKCGHCGRTLTDKQSRAAGIGPVCASRI